MKIAAADLNDPAVQHLIAFHQREMLAASPPGTSFALDLSGLVDPAVTVLAAWDGDVLAGIGAIKRLSSSHAEVKSMRTAPAFLRRGVAARLLDALIAEARSSGIARLSLETGTGERFEPAMALYRRRGFANGAAFAEYRLTEFNQCLHLEL